MHCNFDFPQVHDISVTDKLGIRCACYTYNWEPAYSVSIQNLVARGASVLSMTHMTSTRSMTKGSLTLHHS